MKTRACFLQTVFIEKIAVMKKSEIEIICIIALAAFTDNVENKFYSTVTLVLQKNIQLVALMRTTVLHRAALLCVANKRSKIDQIDFF